MLLEKMLQSQGFGARKFCQQLIKRGSVMVNDVVVSDLKYRCLNLEQLHFQVDGEPYQYHERVYLALYKPQNYECSHQATHHFSVFDLIDPLLLQRGVQCVGRLDQDTTGLLLLTDDGAFLQAMTHPKKHVAKVYQMHTADPISDEQIQQLSTGVALHREDGIFAATAVQRLAPQQLQMSIHQGVYHQVKRMLAAVGNKVQRLHRQQMGELDLASLNLQEGQYCYLTAEQVQQAKMRQSETASL